ncbi:MAG TPA: RluA family pseudouridine synthase [Polyangiaceae bacterium]|nr:RluA family pseudouridine synthase [Polyangiaceae bacterium]
MSEPTTLGSLLDQRGERGALERGGVFVDGQRTESATASLEPGARVEVYAAREEGASVGILAQERGLVFAYKPVGLASEPERRGNASVVTLVAEMLKLDVARVHALTRLDVGVSGVVLLGLDSAARQRVHSLREAGAFERRYVALAHSTPNPANGTWNEALGKAPGGARRCVSSHGEPATTRYSAVASTLSGASILAFRPLTGRTHQLRVHASFHGAPLLGDSTYGGSKRLVLAGGRVIGLPRIYLHAAWIALADQSRVETPLPADFGSTWAVLGGKDSDLDRALVEPLGS